MCGVFNSGGVDSAPRMRLKTGGTTVTHVIDTPEDSPVTGDLAHVVWTYDGAVVTLYLNTVAETLNTGGTQTGTVDGGTAVPLRLGNSAHASTTNEWDAPIYKVVVYDVALNAQQVFALCGNPYGPYRSVENVVGLVPVAGAAVTSPYYSHHYHRLVLG